MEENFTEQARRLLGTPWQQGRVGIQSLSPDGSQRRFCRFIHQDGSKAIAVAPPVGDAVGLSEAISGWNIGRHLFAHGVPVPALYGFDEQCGLLVCEDLGDLRLHDLVLKNGHSSELVTVLYQQTVAELAKMQVRGCLHFDRSWCWDTAQYDRRLMLERESGYFLQALCRDLLNLDFVSQELEQDFLALADRAGQADASFFLHRDFQSRNIMVQQGRVRFIDYQAGRLGPLGYDLASLLIDPYSTLTGKMQDDLLEQYLDALAAFIPYNREQFRQEYVALALQRNLQILGAFAFLSGQRGRPFFRQYILPALHSLQSLLAKISTKEYPYLKSLTDQCLIKISSR